MEGLSVTGLEIVSVFGVTAIAAAIFPFSKKARKSTSHRLTGDGRSWHPGRHFWRHRQLIYLAILFYFFIVMPDLEGLAIGS